MNTPKFPKPVLDEEETAYYIGMSRSWLRISRCQGNPDSPPFLKLGRSVRYLKEDLDQWLEKHRFVNTLGGRAKPISSVERQYYFPEFVVEI